MKILGIIVEYNPFHSGHSYHLEKSKELIDADLVIAVMSGPFLQRGEPAFIDKWSRTKLALAGGADLILELPAFYATQHAGIFAKGAVQTLLQARITDLSFGSENGSSDAFLKTVEWLSEKEQEIEKVLPFFLKEGKSYPRAYYDSVLSLHAKNDAEPILRILSKPNNTLGLHYIKAAKKMNSSINFHTLERIGNDYHQENLSKQLFSSATSIRKALFNNKLSNIQPFLSEYTYEEIVKWKKEYQNFISWNDFFPLLKYKITSSKPADLLSIYGCDEGLEFRIKKAASNASTFEELIKAVKTKRYTFTRLQRLFLHILLNLTRKEAEKMEHYSGSTPRVLGMNRKGRQYLAYLRKEKQIKMITRVSQAPVNDPIHQFNLRSADIYSLAQTFSGKEMVEEYRQIPIMLDK